MGNFAFLTKGNATSAHLIEHEAGHTLNLAIWGTVVHLIGALDENVFGGGANAVHGAVRREQRGARRPHRIDLPDVGAGYRAARCPPDASGLAGLTVIDEVDQQLSRWVDEILPGVSVKLDRARRRKLPMTSACTCSRWPTCRRLGAKADRRCRCGSAIS